MNKEESVEFIRHIKNVFPEGSVGLDNEGQLIIYTGFILNDDQTLTQMDDKPTIKIPLNV